MTEEKYAEGLERIAKHYGAEHQIVKAAGLAKRLIDHKDTASIADAVKKYTAVLSAARQSANPAALDRVRLSAYMLTHALRDWEAAR